MRRKNRHFKAYDLVLPLVQALLSFAVYFVIVGALYAVNQVLGSRVLELITSRLYSFLPLVLLLSFLSCYTNHFRRFKSLSLIVPFLSSLTAVLVIYFLAVILLEINKAMDVYFLGVILSWVADYSIMIFFFILALSYLNYALQPGSGR